MAESRPIDRVDLDFSTEDKNATRTYRRLSTLNGLLIGLAVGLGAWGMDALRIARLPMASYLPLLLAGIGLTTAMGAAIGWLTGRIARTPVTIILWSLAGMAFMLILSYLPYQGRTMMVWLIDGRFRGRDIYPFTLEATTAGLLLGGFFIILALAGLGLMQNYRLEQTQSHIGRQGRLSGRGWTSLLLPLPIVFLASMVTNNTMANPAASAAGLVHQAIPNARDYDGDLRRLDLGDGISYAALRPVHELLRGGDYRLSIVDVNPLMASVVIGVDIPETGAWIYCRVINDQLNFCYDASVPYVRGLHSLVTGTPPPEDCRDCVLPATYEAESWLDEHRARFGPDPAIERLARQGSHVLMQITGDDIVAECWIEGITSMRLTECREVAGALR